MNGNFSLDKRNTVSLIIQYTDNVLVPRTAVQTIQDVMERGAADGKSDWENDNVTLDDCIDHATMHLLRYINTQETIHLDHALTRLAMAKQLEGRTGR